MRYVFILSLDHSRSTIIDLTIADRLGGVSLGEVRRVIAPSEGERKKIRVCSCGATWQDCKFWGGYALNFGRLFSSGSLKNRTLIDSSKEVGHFRKLASIATQSGVYVNVLIIVRTFPEWFSSVKKANHRHGRSFSWIAFKEAEHKAALIRLLLRRVKVIAYAEWLFTNIRLIHAARKQKTYLITEKNDVDSYIRDVYTECTSYSEHHVLRGNRLAASGGGALQDFSLMPHERKLMKAIYRLITD